MIEKAFVETESRYPAAFVQDKFNSINFACKVSVASFDPLAYIVEVQDPSRDIVDLVTDKLNEIGIKGVVGLYEDEEEKADANNDTVSNWREGRFTFRKMLEALQKMSPEQLDKYATVFDEDYDEYYEIQHIGFANKGNDVLDEGHPFLTI